MPTDLRRQWQTEGYVFVPGLLDAPTTARLRATSERILDQWRACDPDNGKPVADPNATMMRHLNRPEYFPGRAGQRAEFVELMEVVAAPQVLGLAREVLNAEPVFYCTSLFMNPLEQSQDGNWHRDSQFVTKTEEEEKAMLVGPGEKGGIQLQIALAPSQDVEIVPGSFKRWDTPEEYAIRRADGFTHNRSNSMPGALRLNQQPGDAVAFDSMGLHRGRYHADKIRRTLMLTYTTAENSPDTYFSRQPWFFDEEYLRPLSPGARAFFERFVETYAHYWKAATPSA